MNNSKQKVGNFLVLSGKYEDYETHQQAYKVFSKSIESIKRKQVEQEFSNGKGDSKKKKFDFQGEMKKFSQEQQIKTIEHVQKSIREQAPPLPPIKETISDKVQKKTENIQENIADDVQKKTENIQENIAEDIQKKLIRKLIYKD